MFVNTQNVLSNTPAIRAMLNFGGCIGLNLADADLSTTVGFMRCLIERGVNSPAEIFDYLSERGSKFDRDMIELLLKHFEGTDARHHLWTYGKLGGYVALTRDGPALWSSNEGYDLN